jgi:hypothetical protein
MFLMNEWLERYYKLPTNFSWATLENDNQEILGCLFFIRFHFTLDL